MTSLADLVVSDLDAPGNSDTALSALREAVTAPEPAQTTTPTSTPSPAAADNDDVPEKFRGKSRAEIVAMYQNLESTNGRMANDLGVQRVLTDRLLGLNDKRLNDLTRNTPPEQRPAPVTANEILDKPQETLDRAIDARLTRVTEDVNARLARTEAALAQTTFAGHHPDFQTVVQSPDFVAWVQSSPLRLRAASVANRGDWVVADELLTEFKNSRPSKTDEAAPAAGADLDGARRASLTTSGAAGKTGADGKSNGGGKLYKRSDLMRLRIQDPEAYYDESFQAEILKAHSEGRVK